MQKKLIALAIAGLSGTAFAQSNVTITGLFDVGYQNFKLQAGNVDTIQQHFGSSSNSGTTNVTFKVVEDLGNGLKAGLHLETDPTAGSANAPGTTGFLNSQNYLWLQGNFGTLKLGYFNNQSNTAAGVAQPFGTGMGGGYSSAFGRLDGFNVVGAPAAVTGVADAATANDVATHGGAGARDIRVNNSMEYTTPTWNGFNANFLYKALNSNARVADSDGQTIVGANYNNGPLNIAYSRSQHNVNETAAQQALQLTHNLLGANYTFGAFTIYGGWTSSKSSLNGAAAGTSGTVDSRSWNIAAKWQATANLSVAANILKVDDKLIGNQDRSLNALGLDYSLSKRTVAYARYESGDNDRNNGASGKFTRFGAGLRHTF